MAKITIEELSGSLKEYLNGLGLTEAQVQELIDKFEDEKIGDISQLSTEEKGSLVGAINELFQSANNGKQLIANAIGEPLSKDDTFSAMSNDINLLTIDFRNALSLKGVNALDGKFKTLINKIDEIVQDGNVLNNQIFMSGVIPGISNFVGKSASGLGKAELKIEYNLDFVPDIVFIKAKAYDSYSSQPPSFEIIVSTTNTMEYSHGQYTGMYHTIMIEDVTNTSCYIRDYSSFNYMPYLLIFYDITWYAIGSSQLPHNGGERTITPSTADQVLPDGYYSGNITVKGDSDLKPENIVEGVEIFGVTGNASKGYILDVEKNGYSLNVLSHAGNETISTSTRWADAVATDSNYKYEYVAQMTGKYTIQLGVKSGIDNSSTLYRYAALRFKITRVNGKTEYTSEVTNTNGYNPVNLTHTTILNEGDKVTAQVYHATDSHCVLQQFIISTKIVKE